MKPRTVPALKASRDLIPRRYCGDQDADQFVLRAVERLASATFQVRHRKIDAKSCDDRDKLCDKYIGVLRKDNKGGGRKYYPKRPRSGEADVLLPSERTTGFQAEGDLRVHRVGS